MDDLNVMAEDVKKVMPFNKVYNNAVFITKYLVNGPITLIFSWIWSVISMTLGKIPEVIYKVMRLTGSFLLAIIRVILIPFQKITNLFYNVFIYPFIILPLSIISKITENFLIPLAYYFLFATSIGIIGGTVIGLCFLIVQKLLPRQEVAREDNHELSKVLSVRNQAENFSLMDSQHSNPRLSSQVSGKLRRSSSLSSLDSMESIEDSMGNSSLFGTNISSTTSPGLEDDNGILEVPLYEDEDGYYNFHPVGISPVQEKQVLSYSLPAGVHNVRPRRSSSLISPLEPIAAGQAPIPTITEESEQSSAEDSHFESFSTPLESRQQSPRNSFSFTSGASRGSLNISSINRRPLQND